MKRIVLLLCIATLPLSAEEGWSHAGSKAESSPSFFVAGGPQIGYFVNEIRRVGGGVDLRGGYLFRDDLHFFLDTSWNLTRQFNVIFHFFDIAPYVSYFPLEQLYLAAGGGVVLARSSSGTRVEGFSTTRGSTELGYLGGIKVGYVLLEGTGISLALEADGTYRRIGSGNLFEPAVRFLVNWQF